MLTAGLALSALAFALATLLMLISSARHTTTIAVALVVFVLEAGAATVLPLEHAPTWMVTGAYGGMAVAFGAWIIALVRGNPGGSDDDGRGFGGGGGGGGGPREPSTPPDAPPWWPEFERDLREYMRDRSLTPG